MTILIKSIIIGMFAIFPGISGSALAISLDIYDNFFTSLKNIKANYKFLLLVIFGLIIGVVLGSNIIINLYNYKNITIFRQLYSCVLYKHKKTNQMVSN
jgi:putative membrane protein